MPKLVHLTLSNRPSSSLYPEGPCFTDCLHADASLITFASSTHALLLTLEKERTPVSESKAGTQRSNLRSSLSQEAHICKAFIVCNTCKLRQKSTLKQHGRGWSIKPQVMVAREGQILKSPADARNCLRYCLQLACDQVERMYGPACVQAAGLQQNRPASAIHRQARQAAKVTETVSHHSKSVILLQTSNSVPVQEALCQRREAAQRHNLRADASTLDIKILQTAALQHSKLLTGGEMACCSLSTFIFLQREGP